MVLARTTKNSDNKTIEMTVTKIAVVTLKT